jgi:hypothetical protein
VLTKRKPRKTTTTSTPSTTPKKKKKRPQRRKSNNNPHYKTGEHRSPKSPGSVIKFRSGWEQSVCEWLDQDPEVVLYQYECIDIRFVSNLKTLRTRRYIPDFLVTYSDGRKVLVEVKRKDQLKKRHTQKKISAGKSWASAHGIEFEIWTEEKIAKIRKLLPPTGNVKLGR